MHCNDLDHMSTDMCMETGWSHAMPSALHGPKGVDLSDKCIENMRASFPARHQQSQGNGVLDSCA